MALRRIGVAIRHLAPGDPRSTNQDDAALAVKTGTAGTVEGPLLSAGGLLMGYISNERPDLFLGIIAQVPFVDICNTMLDEDLPLTVTEIPEWGDLKKDQEAFKYIKSYSPYDNVKKQNYPNMLITGGITDPRVTYWEMTKWIAKLRDFKTDKNLIILDMNMDAGHSGASGRYDYLNEVALTYIFALKISKKISP